MPYLKYVALRKAAEMEGISNRITMISDINAAFSGNEAHVKRLENIYNTLTGLDRITWEKDINWEKKLSRFKR